MQELEQEPNFSEWGFIGRPTPAASNSILLVTLHEPENSESNQ